MGAVAFLVAGGVLGAVSRWHGATGGAGSGGRPFLIFLLVCLIAVFVLESWDGET